MELRSVLGGVRTSCVLVLLPALYAACGGDSFTSEGGPGGFAGDASAGTGGTDTGGTGGGATGGTGGTATGGTGGAETGGTGGVETGGTGGAETGGTGGTGGAETGGTGGSATGGTGGGCDPSQKWCDDACVELNDPHFGCDVATCEPCALPNVLEHACDATRCAIAVCETAWGDCDDKADSGCEQDLRSMDHCGDCGVACVVPDHGTANCDTATCQIDCATGFERCDNRCVEIGEEVAHCLGCNQPCEALPNRIPSCTGGVCSYECVSGFDMCGAACVSLSTDEKNCGWCGHDCGPNSACDNGFCAPHVLHASSAYPIELAVDPGEGSVGAVYWATAGSNGAVMHVAKTGGTVENDLTSTQPIASILIDQSYLFVGAGNEIQRKSRVGTGFDLQYTTSGAPLDMAQTGDRIFWTQTSSDPGLYSASKTIAASVAKILEPNTTITFRFPRPVSGSTSVYYTGLSTAGTNTCFVGVTSQDSTASAVATGLPYLGGLALNDTSLFWTLPSVGKVHTVARENAGTPDVIGLDVPGVEAIEADGDFIAWAQNITTSTGGKIVGRYGAVNRTLAQGEQSVCAIALDKTFVYWINCKAQGSVKRVAR